MTDKEKQIDSLANALYNKQDEFDMSNPFEVANCVINLGYRKIPEGSVVLSKEEYQELEELRLNRAKDLINANKLYEERIADLKIEFDNHIKNLEGKIDRRDRDLNSQANRLINLKEELAQARKETARDILGKLGKATNDDERYKVWCDLIEHYGYEVEE